MQLTDNEIRKITRYLEEGKPLPDKYRFLPVRGQARGGTGLEWKDQRGLQYRPALSGYRAGGRAACRKAGGHRVADGPVRLDERGRQLKGWTNKLIWGDNKLILSSLKNGPLREEIEKQGGLKLIYIDPPFDVGADF